MTGRTDVPTVGQAPPTLEFRGVSKRYGAVQAVRDVSFEIAPGEVLGLVGDNGAGKSTIVSMIAGTVAPDAGHILLDGTELQYGDPAASRSRGIETVYQFLNIIPTLDIAENVFLGRELRKPGLAGRLGWIDGKRMRADAALALTDAGFTLPGPTQKVANLSGGQRQAVAVARSLLWGDRLVLLDEPTAALGVKQQRIVLTYIDGLRSRGVAVLFISLNIPQILGVADRVAVLRLGRVVAEYAAADASHSDLVGMLTGARADAPRLDPARRIDDSGGGRVTA